MCGDVFAVLSALARQPCVIDKVFLAPPWGGPDYAKAKVCVLLLLLLLLRVMVEAADVGADVCSGQSSHSRRRCCVDASSGRGVH